MNIAQFAAASGLSIDTLLDFEREELLDPPRLESDGAPAYDEKHMARVHFIKSAYSLQFSSAQIRAILPCILDDHAEQLQIQSDLQSQLEELGRQIAELLVMKRSLLETFAIMANDLDMPASSSRTEKSCHLLEVGEV
jgi:Predicted transcriptional regulators